MKVFKWIADNLIRQVVTIDESQFGFVPGSDTTDAIFVIRQLKEKYFTVGKQIYMAIMDLQKVFDRVPQKVIRWAMRKLVLYEWIVSLVYEMLLECTAQCTGEGLSDEFEGKVGVHQGSGLSPQHRA